MSVMAYERSEDELSGFISRELMLSDPPEARRGQE
jgi:hypothetical protein